MIELLSGERISTTCLAVFTSHWTATDGQTNRHTDEYFPIACMPRCTIAR